jgi:hypothetical protein
MGLQHVTFHLDHNINLALQKTEPLVMNTISYMELNVTVKVCSMNHNILYDWEMENGLSC